MDKSSDRYKELCKNPKFERRAARLWYKALNEHNKKLFLRIDYDYLKKLTGNLTDVQAKIGEQDEKNKTTKN